MKNIIKISALFLLVTGIYSCASIPASTATLTDEVIAEAASMHRLNIALVNQLFDERKAKVNDFINNQYIPAYVKNFEAKIPPNIDVKAELPNILKSIMPVINRKRDSMQNMLDTQRNNILQSLNESYTNYQRAGSTLQNLVNSAVELKQRESATITQIENLTRTNINVNRIENHLDSLLVKTGNGFSKLLNVEKDLKN